MAAKVLICDDSRMARKQLSRALPDSFDANVCYATNGLEAMDVLRQGQTELMFLDLTMPEMDGYHVLQALQEENINLDIIVISGDIQLEAQRRVKSLGAREFIKKPCEPEHIDELLEDMGYKLDGTLTFIDQSGEPSAHGESSAPGKPSTTGTHSAPSEPVISQDVSPIERIEEISNVAMGRAASLLAETLGVFIVLPLPVVNEVEASELKMAVAAVENGGEKSIAVCQGFIGSAISGEAFLMLHDTGIHDLAKLLNYTETDDTQIEVLMDIANILISASLKGFEEQLDIRFSMGHPTVLGHQEGLQQLLGRAEQHWRKTLAIEFDYSVEERDIECTLLLLISEDAIPVLNQRTAYLA